VYSSHLTDARLMGAKVEAQLAAIKTMHKLLRSFFEAPSVTYITDC
jgi:hypothetical protein